MTNAKGAAPRGNATETTKLKFALAVAAEIARLKSEGYGKAYIYERSFEIEDRIRQRFV